MGIYIYIYIHTGLMTLKQLSPRAQHTTSPRILTWHVFPPGQQRPPPQQVPPSSQHSVGCPRHASSVRDPQLPPRPNASCWILNAADESEFCAGWKLGAIGLPAWGRRAQLTTDPESNAASTGRRIFFFFSPSFLSPSESESERER